MLGLGLGRLLQFVKKYKRQNAFNSKSPMQCFWTNVTRRCIVYNPIMHNPIISQLHIPILRFVFRQAV